MLPFWQASLNHGDDPALMQELLTSLWVKCNDIVLLRSTSSARYFAGFPTGYTALLGGLTENGRSAVNVLSFACLDAYQNVRLPQPNLGVRVNELIDRPFLRKTAETVRLGTGIPQIFNDEVVVPAFLNRGVSLEDARDYAVVGCVELSIPGRTYGLHDIAMFNLLKVMEIVMHEHEGDEQITYDGLLASIRDKIRHYIQLMVEGSNICDIGHRDWAPVPLLSSFVEDCIEKGKDITAGGARYNFSGVQGIGIANLSDSLHALKGMVFDQQRMSFDELLAVLKANFATPEGEKVRARLINRFEKYGNDIDDVDNISADLLRFYCKEVEKYRNPRGGQFTPGSYTVSAHVPLGSVVGATPDGRFAGEQLADGGLSPMVGQDAQGPTAVLKSVSKLDNYLLSNGTLLNVKFTPSTLEGESGLNKLADFLHAFTKLKLQHIQFNVVNAETLREAQQRPQDFAGLVVRVAATAPSLSSCRRRFRMTLSAAPRISCEVIETRADTARIFNIQRYSLNDGQGIRTVVFFKGCPHTCPWCANPESMSPRIETVRRESKCLHCATCLQDAEECPSGAWENIGRDVTLEELEREVLKDEVFFRASGGGVTLSGGEVLMQAEFAARLLQRLKQWVSARRLKPQAIPRRAVCCRWQESAMRCCST